MKIDAVWPYLDIVYVKHTTRARGETERERERSGRQLTQQWEWINTPSLQEHDQILNTIRQGLKQLLVKSVYTGNFFQFILLFWNLKKNFWNMSDRFRRHWINSVEKID